MKKITFLVAFLIAAISYGQVNNGDFETAAGADWTATYYSSGSVDPTGSFETTNGNPNGYYKFNQGDILGNNQQASSIINSVISAPITLALNDILTIDATVDAKSAVVFNAGDDTQFRLSALIPKPRLDKPSKASNKSGKFSAYSENLNTWQNLSASATLTVDNTTHDAGDYTVQIRIDFGKFVLNEVLEIDNVSVVIKVNGTVLSTEHITKDDASLTLYPNPASNLLTINATNRIEKIEVFNMLGKLVLDSNSNSNKIDVSNLSSGMYISKIYQENDIISTKRFVKQ